MEEKIARICWNGYDWKKPSGPVGKSKDENSFEVHPGFGHEEWIFDFDTLIDGYKYAFLDPVRTDNNIYKGKELVDGSRVLLVFREMIGR